MIRRVKVKFVALAMTALLALLAAIVAGMNLVNYRSIVSEADRTLAALSQNRGDAPSFREDAFGRFSPFLSPETPSEARFFSVLLSPQGRVLQTDTRRAEAVDESAAAELAGAAFRQERSQGFLRQYRFARREEDGGVRMLFLDCGGKLHSFYHFLFFSISMALTGYILFFFVILFFSGRFLKPVTESYEKQKRFITDAGHEIKTPLAIIKADADVLEMEYGPSEWLDGIQAQVRRLADLTADLTCLSRLEEAGKQLPMQEFSFSDAVRETALSFQPLAQDKDFRLDVAPTLTCVGNEHAIRQLVSILMDNALKYTPEGGKIRLDAGKQGRHLLLTVYNTTREPVTREQLSRLFERFYRGDASRSSEIAGYGIGLSIAQAVTAAHNGKITAGSEDGRSLEITVRLPT